MEFMVLVTHLDISGIVGLTPCFLLGLCLMRICRSFFSFNKYFKNVLGRKVAYRACTPPCVSIS